MAKISASKLLPINVNLSELKGIKSKSFGASVLQRAFKQYDCVCRWHLYTGFVMFGGTMKEDESMCVIARDIDGNKVDLDKARGIPQVKLEYVG